jgi:hypothetical protein
MRTPSTKGRRRCTNQAPGPPVRNADAIENSYIAVLTDTVAWVDATVKRLAAKHAARTRDTYRSHRRLRAP